MSNLREVEDDLEASGHYDREQLDMMEDMNSQ